MFGAEKKVRRLAEKLRERQAKWLEQANEEVCDEYKKGILVSVSITCGEIAASIEEVMDEK